jgi:hypothetical protein
MGFHSHVRMTNTRNRLDTEPVTVERIERALAIVARCVVLDGDIYLQLYESLERDLDALRVKQDVLSRVHQRAATYKVDGGLKEIA